VPAATTPLSIAENEQGNWFVAREGGDNQATSYERWSHALKACVIITISDSGASNVLQTASLDPDNGTWTPMWPSLDNQGRKRFDNHVSRTGNVLHSSTQFYDAPGQGSNQHYDLYEAVASVKRVNARGSPLGYHGGFQGFAQREAEKLGLARGKASLVSEVPMRVASFSGVARQLVYFLQFELPLDQATTDARNEIAVTNGQIMAAVHKWLRASDFVRVILGPAPQ
jgi:hypothetical protein